MNVEMKLIDARDFTMCGPTRTFVYADDANFVLPCGGPSMRCVKRALSVLLPLVLCGLTLAAGQVTISEPGDVGFSPDRLKRINELIQRRIDAGQISGAVTLVARRGRLVHLAAQGLANID